MLIKDIECTIQSEINRIIRNFDMGRITDRRGTSTQFIQHGDYAVITNDSKIKQLCELESSK